MLDRFKIDSHKLSYHIPRLHQWLQGKNIYPIYVEIGLFRGCNHRCIFCAFDFLKYKPQTLDTQRVKKFILQAKAKGVKAILYSGEGEPLLHKDAVEIIRFTRQAGIDVALASNGVMMNPEIAMKIIPSLSWLKISLNAGTRTTYIKVHKARRGDFDLVLRNLKAAVAIRNKYGYSCTIGAQSVLLTDNFYEMEKLAKKLRALGVDYLAIKPYSWHCFSRNKLKVNFQQPDLLALQKRLQRYSAGKFAVIFRSNAMAKMNEEKPYLSCLGFSFATHVADTGNVYPCTVFIGNKKFRFGNICTDSFKKIWEGKLRKRVLKELYRSWDIQRCRGSCRIDEINRYLWELKHPVEHVNFI
jgi:radical SAM protein with 4Fe4S-binding SPASM domain